MATRPAKKTMVSDAAAVHDGLKNVVAGLGTARDKMSYSEYSQVNILPKTTLENAYRGSWLAGKIVDLPADDMTRAWRSFTFEDADDEQAKDIMFQLETAERKYGIQHKANEALKWSRLYGGAVLFIGVKGDKDYEKPLNVEAIKKDSLTFVHVLDRWLAAPSGEIDWDVESPNFLRPEYYIINGTLKVHHSRIIRFISRKLPYTPSMTQQWWGDSELQRTYEALVGKDTVTAAIATMIFEANVDVISAEGLADTLSSAGGEAKLTKRYQVAAMMKSFNRMLLLDSTEVYDKKSNTFAGLADILREFRSEVAGACDIPVSRLFGTSSTGLNATGDNEVRNYYDRIASEQEAHLRPALEKLDEIFIRSTLGNMPDDYQFTFKPLWQMSDTEQSTVEKTRADRDKVYYDMGVLTAGTIAKQLKEDGAYNVMTSEDIELAEEVENQLNTEGLDPVTGQPLNNEGLKNENTTGK